MWKTVIANEIMYTLTATEYANINAQSGMIVLLFILGMGASLIFVYETHIAKLKKKWGVVEKIEKVR